MKTLDMADKYPPAESFEDEDTTVRIQVPTFIPQVVVGGPENDDFDLHGDRDTIPCPPPYPLPYEQKRVNWGAVGILLFTLAFWSTVSYFIFR